VCALHRIFHLLPACLSRHVGRTHVLALVMGSRRMVHRSRVFGAGRVSSILHAVAHCLAMGLSARLGRGIGRLARGPSLVPFLGCPSRQVAMAPGGCPAEAARNCQAGRPQPPAPHVGFPWAITITCVEDLFAVYWCARKYWTGLDSIRSAVVGHIVRTSVRRRMRRICWR